MIRRVKFRNYRLFSELDFQLDQGGAVVVGRNASGKSSLLRGLVTGLGAYTNAIGGPVGPPLNGEDVRQTKSIHSTSVSIESSYPIEIEIEISVCGRDDNIVLSADSLDQVGRLIRNETNRLRGSGLNDTEGRDLPLIALYPSHRSAGSGEPTLNLNQAVGNAPNRVAQGYADWHQAGLNVQSFAQSLVREELVSLQEGSPTEVRVILEEAVRSSLQGSPTPRFLVKEAQIVLEYPNGDMGRIAQLSDGQRSILNLVADIATRCIHLNPHFGPQATSMTSGVVLVDEIDLHLHPAWQRTVVSSLEKAFPSIQFILTTHSPQILGEVPPSHVRILEDGQLKVPNRSYGMDSNTILESLMDAESRTPKAAADLVRVAELIERGDLDGADEALNSSDVKFGRDEDFQRLRSRVQRLRAFEK